MLNRAFVIVVGSIVMLASNPSVIGQRIMERLDRGVVAVRFEDSRVWVGWRLLGTDPPRTVFNVYRSIGDGPPVRLTPRPIADVTFFIDESPEPGSAARYSIRPVLDERELPEDGSFLLPADAAVGQSLSIPLDAPEGYRPGDASAADLDGDGAYEIVVLLSRDGRDNSQSGITSPVLLQAYRLDGRRLWTIDLGPNIRSGAHYTPFLVYDFDSDGRAELICRTADGTVDGTGRAIGDASARHANPGGHVLRGPEFLTVFDGPTGAAIDTVRYHPARTNNHPENPDLAEYKALWGDDYGNRGERYLAAVAYLDGRRPSAVMCRGYYTRTVLTAWDFQDRKLVRRWVFDTNPGTPDPALRAFHGQGNHNLSVADVNDDGKDDLIYGGAVIGSDGKGLFSTGYGHGDAIHVGDLDPDNPGLEMFRIQEPVADAGAHLVSLRSGETLWKKPSVRATTGRMGEGPGRGVSFDIDPRHPGNECWVFGGGLSGLWDVKGNPLGDKVPTVPVQTTQADVVSGAWRDRKQVGSCNFRVYWDGDLLDEILDRNAISKWNWEKSESVPLFVADGCVSINGTKATPALSADLFGDWREEVVLPTIDGKQLRIFTTTIPTKHRLYTLMHDPQYRLSIAWQNVGYNQPPHVGWYMNSGKPPTPNLSVPTSPR